MGNGRVRVGVGIGKIVAVLGNGGDLNVNSLKSPVYSPSRPRKCKFVFYKIMYYSGAAKFKIKSSIIYI